MLFIRAAGLYLPQHLILLVRWVGVSNSPINREACLGLRRKGLVKKPFLSEPQYRDMSHTSPVRCRSAGRPLCKLTQVEQSLAKNLRPRNYTPNSTAYVLPGGLRSKLPDASATSRLLVCKLRVRNCFYRSVRSRRTALLGCPVPLLRSL